MLASWGAANTVHLWDAGTGRPIRRFAGHEAFVSDVAFAPDGRIVATGGGSGGDVVLWDADSGKSVGRLNPGAQHVNVTGIAYSPDGRLLAAASADGKIRLWQPAAGRLLQSLAGTQGWATSVAYSPDGQHLASSGHDNIIRLWRVGSPVPVRQWKVDPAITRLAFSPDGKILAMGGGAGVITVRAWDVATGKEQDLVRQPDPSGVTGIAFSADGRMLVSSDLSERIVLWELATGQVRLSIRHPGYVSTIALSPDGRLLASGNDGRGSKLVFRMADPGKTDCHVVHLWDVVTGKEVLRLDGHRGGVTSLAFSPDGTRMVSGSQDTTALVWDVSAARDGPPTAAGDWTPADRAALWKELGQADAAAAYRTMGRMVQAPKDSVALLASRLRKIEPADAAQVARLLADLDSHSFTVRERTVRTLARLGPGVEPRLRKALDARPTPEVRRRVEELLKKFEITGQAERRAVEVLERIGTPEARDLLDRLANGVSEARLTNEAKGSLKRFDQRGSVRR